MNYTQKMMHRDIEALAEKYKKYKYSDLVVAGITTGGIIPAYLLAQELECVYINIRPNKRIPKTYLNCQAPILFIDDIIDSGETKIKIMSQFKGNKKNVWFDALVKPPTKGWKKKDWVQFFWETIQDLANSRQQKL